MFMEISSCKIHYELQGSGKAVVLLHGWGQKMIMMQFLADHLQEHYCVLNIDLPGFGESDEPPMPWNVADYARCIKKVCDELELKNPSLIAHSFGARIAFHYAYSYPCYKLILTGAAGIRKKRTWSYYMRVYIYKLRKRLQKNVAMGSTDFQAASIMMRKVLVNAVEDDVRSILSNLHQECLLVWGEQDEATPLWMGEEMVERMPNATLIVLKNDDHFAYFHQANRFCGIVDAFL